MSKWLHPYGSSTANLDSLTYRTHLDSPKNFPGMFRTHTTSHSSCRPAFSDTFVQLSQSGMVEKWLAGANAAIVFTTNDGETCRRGVPQGAIVLCERKGNAWVLQVPGADGWSKPYAGSATERSVDARTEAMLARDFVRSAAIHESQVSDSNKAGI